MRRYEPGTEIIAGIKIISHIGAGGFGNVYKVSVAGGIEKALKVINLQGTQGVKEFNALKLIKKISHPNLVPIDSYWLRDLGGRLIDFASDDSINAEKQSLELIILMGLGRMSLHDMLMQYMRDGKQGIPVSELIELMSDTAKAIDYLNEPHDLGLKEKIAIQHGDIKPGNILLVGNSIQVCDYGLAKAITSSKGARTSIALFSPGYCSPEMNRNQPSNWSDQFSLAISYYEMRTGKLPFNEEEEINAGIVAALGNLDFSGVSKGERDVLLKATTPIPNQRYPKCIDLINALRATAFTTARDSGPRPRSLDELLRPDTEIVPGYKLGQRISHGERDEFWKATAAGKPFIIYVIREFRGALGNQLLQSLESLRQLEEHENLINLRNCWTINSNGQSMPYDDVNSVENQTVALVALLDNVDCTLEDYYNECLKVRRDGISDTELLRFMKEAADALDFLNSKLMAPEFLDLKPQTLLLTKNKRVKLGISGLAKRLMSSASSLTTERLVNAFAPPELFDFEVGKHWNSNQYSLALTYYWLRSLGHLPFPNQSTPKQIRDYHLAGKLDFSEIRSERERDILETATMLDPNSRYSTCFEFIDSMQVVMGVSIPQPAGGYGGGLRITPNLPERPTHNDQSGTKRDTKNQGRDQQRTPSTRPSDKTPQKHDSRGTYVGTLEELPALSDNQWNQRQSGEAGFQSQGLLGSNATDEVTMVPDEEEDSHLYSAFRQGQDENKKKRRKTRTAIITVVGLTLAIAAGVVAFFVLNPGKGTASNTGPKPSDNVVSTEGTIPVKNPLEQVELTIKGMIDKEQFEPALAEINKASADEAWKTGQKQKLAGPVQAMLETKLNSLLEAKKQIDAKTELDKSQQQFPGLLDKAWVNNWTTKLAPPAWSAKFAELKGKLKGLNDIPSLKVFETELKDIAKDAKEDQDKLTASQLMTAVTSLITLTDAIVKEERPDALKINMEKYAGWKKTTEPIAPDLVASGSAQIIPNKVIDKARQALADAKTSKDLLNWLPLLKDLVKTRKETWIKSAILEAGLMNPADRDEAIAKEFKPEKPLDHHILAAWIADSNPDGSLKEWKQAYPGEEKTWDAAVQQPDRKARALQKLTTILQQYREKDSKTCVFKPEKQKESLDTIKLILALSPEKKPLDQVELAILEDMNDPQSGSLQKVKTMPYYEKLDDGVKKVVKARVFKKGIAVNAPLADRIEYGRDLVEGYFANKGVSPADIAKNFLVATYKTTGANVPENLKDMYSLVLSDLGEELLLRKEKWSSALEQNELDIDISHELIKIATDLRPSNGLFQFRKMISDYQKGVELSDKSWERLGNEFIQKTPDAFHGYFILGCYSTGSVVFNNKNGSEADAYVQVISQSDKLLETAMQKITSAQRHAKSYQYIIALERSNIHLKIANCKRNRTEQEEHLNQAESLCTKAMSYDGAKPSYYDTLGCIYEDMGMLLEKPDYYKKAIEQYDNSRKETDAKTGQAIELSGSLRSKPLLHSGRCRYRLGVVIGDQSIVLAAQKDLEFYLRSVGERPVDIAEAKFFFAYVNGQLARATQSDSSEEKQIDILYQCLDDLKTAYKICKDNNERSYTRNIEVGIQDCAFAMLDKYIKLFNPDYKKFLDNRQVQKILSSVEAMVKGMADDDPLKHYLNGRLLDYKATDIKVVIGKILEHYTEAIKLASKVNDSKVLLFAYESRALLYLEGTKEYDKCAEDSASLYTVACNSLLTSTARKDMLLKAFISHIKIYELTKSDRYWVVAKDYLLTSMRTYSNELREREIRTAIQRLYKMPPKLPENSTEKETPKEQFVAQAKQAISQLSTAQQTKFKSIVSDLLK